MKPAAAVTTHTVDFQPRPAPRPTVTPTGRVPRVARLLALAHKVDAMIRAGELRDLAHAAKVMGLTRARVTQVMNLLLLAPEIQEAILEMPPVTKGRDTVTERALRRIVAEPDWERQTGMWCSLAGDRAQPPTTRPGAPQETGSRRRTAGRDRRSA